MTVEDDRPLAGQASFQNKTGLREKDEMILTSCNILANMKQCFSQHDAVVEASTSLSAIDRVVL